jgi:ATP-dependent Clp protease adaptor protein ClpS
MSSTDTLELTELENQTVKPFACAVWNDPVNLMSYVTHVFMSYFNYSKAKAEKLMLQVHHEGRAFVSHGDREKVERDVAAMHEFGLWATVEETG